jgi:hypothetical protein
MVNTTLDIVVNLQVEAAKKQLQQLNQIVGFMNSQMAKTITPGQEVRQLSNDLANMLKTQDQMAAISGKNNANYKAATEEVKKLQKELGLSTAQTEKLRQKTKAFSFDFLTLLFAGMMLQRTFGGMFKSIIDGYKKTVGLNSQFNRSVLKLQANFEFLKFSIANALNSPFVINAIEWFTDRINQLSDFFLDHPGFAKAILAVVGALATIGTLSMIASGVKQIEMLLGIMGLTSTATAIENLTKLAKIGTIVIGLSLSLAGIYDMVTNGIDLENTLKTAIGAAFLGFAWFSASRGLAGAALTGLGIGAITAFALVSFKLIFFDIDKTMEQDAGWARAGNLLLKALGAMVAGALAGAGIGSFIPGVGTLIGGLIGFIVAGIGVLFKLSNYRDEIDTSNFTTEAISKEAQKLSHNISIPLDQNITQNSNLLSSALSNIKDNTIDTTIATEEFKKKSEETNNVITIMNTSVSDLTSNQNTLNTYITDANTILPTYNSYLETNISKLERQATAANKAAAAQERLNRAMKDKATSNSSSKTGSSKNSTTQGP